MARTKIHPPEYEYNGYMSLLLNGVQQRQRILIGIPMTGLVRAEWALARWGAYIPPNWTSSDCIQFLNQMTPLGYSVADARNLIVHTALQHHFEWVFFNDSDTIVPPHIFVTLNDYMREAKIPVVAGLYFAKCAPAEPLVYRGRGNSYFARWQMGDKVWVDGVPMGCTLIHCSVLQAMATEAPEYLAGGVHLVKQVFDTPKVMWTDPEAGTMQRMEGTEDLAWCDRVIRGEFLKKAGWPAVAKRKWPFLIDTTLFCYHIREDGVKFPLEFRW